MSHRQSYMDMGYVELKGESGDMDILCKQFENGGAWIAHFNESIRKEPVGMIYLSKTQLGQLSLLSKVGNK